MLEDRSPEQRRGLTGWITSRLCCVVVENGQRTAVCFSSPAGVLGVVERTAGEQRRHVDASIDEGTRPLTQ